MEHLERVWSLLSSGERRELLRLIPGIIATGLLQMVGVASLMPFMTIVSDTTRIQSNQLLRTIYDAGGFASATSFLIVLGLFVLVLLVVGNAASAMSTWSMLRFSWMRNHSISTRLLSAYVDQPYAFFLSKNSSDLSNNILSEVQHVVNGIIVQGVQMLARLVVSACLLLAIVVVEPVLAVLVFSVLGGAYGAIFLFIRRRVHELGRERGEVNAVRHRLTAELLGGIKDVKFYGMEKEALARFEQPSERYASAMATSTSLSAVPRYGLEVVAFGGVMIIVMYLLITGKPTADAFPLIGLYAFASYRLLPALQVAFAAMTTIRFNGAALVNICDQFAALTKPPANLPDHDLDTRLDTVVPIVLDDVAFRYPASDVAVVDDIQLVIPRGHWVAFVGTTGSGKSTLCDIILGLLKPTAGAVQVGGQPFDDVVARRWRRSVGYVPQQIFLVDDTIRRNITFGSRRPHDEEAMRAAARTARIADFIEASPECYDGVVGERGVRLSGGQRQRLGIARALYAQPDVLVLDEATSALDTETERAFFAELRERHRDTTVVMVAHRLSTVRDCDCIFLMQGGRIVARGTYDDLVAGSDDFRALVGPSVNDQQRPQT